MEGGDPNTINKVISEMLNNLPNLEVIQIVFQYNNGKRMLRNYARGEEDKDLIRQINEADGKPTDYTEWAMNFQQAYWCERFEDRVGILK